MKIQAMLLTVMACMVPAYGVSLAVTDFSAVADGETDCTAAFQDALDKACESGGGVVEVPAGHYCIKGTLTIPESVTLQGVFSTPPTDQRNGTVLEAYAGRGKPDGDPFIRLGGHMAVLAGVTITYPEWDKKDVPPAPYPPTLMAEHVVNTAVKDCLFLNSYEGLVFRNAARFIVRNVFGYPSKRGLYIDNCLDISRIENCHFWPFGTVYKPGDPYSKWINLNGVAFEFARTDWQYCTNTFCFGYGIGYKFSRSDNGSCNGNFTGIGADCCRRAVLVDTAPGTLDLLITNGEFVGRWGSTDSVGVEIAGETDQRVSLVNCSFWGPLDHCIWARSPDARLSVSSSGFNAWDIGCVDSAAVRLEGGKAILQGNTFRHEGLHVYVGEKIDSAILIGNQGGVGIRVENKAGDRTQMTANEKDTLTWTDEARLHYRVDVGSAGDSRYVSRCYGPEDAGEWKGGGRKRWLSPEARLHLPVVADTEYTMTVNVHVPKFAISEYAGLYLNGDLIVELPDAAGVHEIEATVPAQDKNFVELTSRSEGWIPAEVIEKSNDHRRLGIALRELEMEAAGAGRRVFDANRGKWIE